MLAPVSVTATGALAGVQLPVPSASLVMHRLLLETVANFPDVFGGVDIPIDPRAFAQQYAAVLTAFEVARASSPERVAVAQFVTDEIQRTFPFVSRNGVATSLEEAMEQAVSPLPTTTVEYPYAQSGDGYRLSVPYRGRVYSTQVELLALADRLERENVMQKEAAQAFRWTVRHAFADGRDGVIRLRGEKFALLGGDAELSPIRALLEAGAEVFTTHLSPGWINRFIEEAGEFGGRLVYATQGANLLTQTPEIAATIERFAGKRPVHLGTFAYAGGQGREWRLGAAMDAVVKRLGDRVRSVTSWRTPSIVAEVSPEMARIAQERFEGRSGWQRFLHRLSGGRLFSPNIVAAGDRFFAQSVVPLQGPSYAGMNLFGKVYGAEVLGENVTVSANVAPITATHSMDTPAMRAGFREAENFDIYVADPAFTRAVTFLLMVHDLFDPWAAASVAKKSLDGETAGAMALFRQQAHGGVFTSPFQLGGLLTYATVMGNLKRWNPFQRSPELEKWSENAEEASVTPGATTWVAPSSPAAFERAVRQLKGPLAGAIAGAGEMTPARAMFLGHTNVVPRGGNRLFAIVSWANRYLPWLAGAVRRIARQEVYGSLLTTILFKERGRDDQIVLTVDPSGLLRSVRLRRTSRQDLEFRLGEGPIKRVEQIIHYGRRLADGSSHLSLGYAYDEADGILKSLGSTQINRDFGTLGPFSIGSSPIPLAHWGTFADLTQQSPVGSLTFLPNAGILREALRFLRDPFLAVDFSRVTIQRLEFQRGETQTSALGNEPIDTAIQPVSLTQTRQGELLQAALVQSTAGGEVQRTIVSILVRGNHPRPPDDRIERVVDRRLAEVAGGRNISVRLMGDRALVDFAVLSGDSNPLHQIDGVARVVGFRRRISPGFGTLAQIEAAVRALFDAAVPQATLSRLTGTLVRPGYPGEAYELECAPEVGTPRRYRYQLVQTGRERKVLVDGLFEIG